MIDDARNHEREDMNYHPSVRPSARPPACLPAYIQVAQCFLRSPQFPSQSKNSWHFTETGSSSPCSHKSANCPCRAPYNKLTLPYYTFKTHLIITSDLGLRLRVLFRLTPLPKNPLNVPLYPASSAIYVKALFCLKIRRLRPLFLLITAVLR
jgi:hypothetical protein